MASKTYYFLKTRDGRYLQGQFEGGAMHFWLEQHTKRAWTACHDSQASAEAYRAAAAATVREELVIVSEAL